MDGVGKESRDDLYRCGDCGRSWVPDIMLMTVQYMNDEPHVNDT